MDAAGEELWNDRHQLTADELERRVEELTDAPVRTYMRGWIAAINERADEALSHLDEASRGFGPEDIWQGRVHRTRGDVLSDIGDDLAAERHYREAARLFKNHGDVAGQVNTLQNSAFLGFHSVESSRARLLEALELARSVRDDEMITVILISLGESWMPTDQDTAYDYIVEALFRGKDYPHLRISALLLLSGMAMDRGDLDEAGAILDPLDDPEEPYPYLTRRLLVMELARLARLRGDGHRAVELLLSVFPPQMHPRQEGPLQAALSEAYEVAGDLSAALQAARRCSALQDELAESTAARRAQALDTWHRSRELLSRNESAQVQIDTLEHALEELRAAHAKIRALAVTDALTGIHNRKHLLEEGPALLAAATPERPAQMALLDIDHFKHINDTCGHHVGDQALKNVAALLVKHTRKADLVCRHGGDEFVVIRPPHVQESLADDMIRLCEAVQLEARAQGQDDTTERVAAEAVSGVSVGVHHVLVNDLDAAMSEADALMYRSKRAGGGRVTADR